MHPDCRFVDCDDMFRKMSMLAIGCCYVHSVSNWGIFVDLVRVEVVYLRGMSRHAPVSFVLSSLVCVNVVELTARSQ